MKPGNHRARFVFGGLALLLLLTGAVLVLRHGTPGEEARATHQAAPSARTIRQAITSPTNGEIIRRPLPVSLSGDHHDWTADDAKNARVIERIAHNPEEVKRLTEENARIKRRQLVYRKETVPMLLERAGSQALKEFTLPGLDGREIEVEVLETRLNGLHAGSLMGRVKGVANSLVSVGFFNGCESFNVCLPDEGYYLTADAREPGEVLVKEIDPNLYTPPTKCEPIVIE